MAAALEEDEIDNDDYYSLLNVRREVWHFLVYGKASDESAVRGARKQELRYHTLKQNPAACR